MEGIRHTRHGWWLEEAGAVTPTRPLESDTSADVVIVGGGYLGLWTAWHLLVLEPGIEIALLEAAVCGHGPSGRNGGFCETLWGDVETLRERGGDAAALAVCRASEDAVGGIGDWCRDNEVDAWYRPAPMLRVATTESQLGSWDGSVDACTALGADDEIVPLSREEVRARCDSPLFLGGSAQRLNATVQPARLGLGLRGRLLERGLRLYERTSSGGSVPSHASVSFAVSPIGRNERPFATARAFDIVPKPADSPVASSHIVLTEPVPDVLEDLGWTGGEAIVDSRTLVHYMRTTADDRIAFGWGGGTMGFGSRGGSRLELDAGVIRRSRESLVRFFPQLRGRRVTHAWGGPIDVSPTHLPIFGSRGRVHHGFGFTGNGVGPTYLGGQILARLALDRRDERTSLAIVEPARKLFPPEPFKYVGGSLIRQALLRKDATEDEGRTPDAVTAFVAALPHRLGLHLPR